MQNFLELVNDKDATLEMPVEELAGFLRNTVVHLRGIQKHFR